MTNNSIFTRVLALMICFVMLAGSLTACFQETEHNHNVGTTTNGEVTTKPTTKPTTTTPTTGDVVENNPEDDPVEDPVAPVDPNEIFSASTNITSDSLIYGTLASDVVIGGTEVGALVPADVKVEAGASNLALSLKKVDEVLLSDALSTLDVHINGVALDNTVPMIVKLGAILEAGLGATELKLYHTEDGVANLMTRVSDVTEFAIHNQYYYNAETGEVTIYVASFSLITAVKSEADTWDGTVAEGFASGTGTEEDPYIIETAEQLAYFRAQVDGGNTFAGKTVKLGVDIDLANIPFDPIGFGYWKEDKVVDEVDNNTVFMGTFDGGNHTIYNLYENCWELDPDKYTYSTAGAGLFASIKDATIKNLAISGAEIVFECVDMGIVVGYAQGVCHFENIVVTDSKIANYNRYTGGVVGEVSYGPYGIDTSKGYSHTFKNITVDSSVTVSGLWGSFGCGMGGVIGGKWGDATVKMENVVSAPVMDVYNDVVSAYQWYAFRGCGMLIGHTEEPYSDGRHSGIATANFLTCENVKVYYGDWVNYTYYEFENQDNATGRSYPWVRAEAGEYCDAFSNIRYGVPTHDGVKVSDLNEEELKAIATDYTPIVFNQLYGADRGMYGQEAHDGVSVIKTNTKTIYILNNQEWENLKLHYWYKHGDDTWTNIDSNGLDMSGMYLSSYNVYKVELPAYADSFKIVADGENEVQFTLADLEDGKTYTVGGEIHKHNFVDDKCECGAYKIQKWELVTDANDLAVDDQIIIVAVDDNYAIGINQATNNRTAFAIVRNADGTITISNNVQVLTLVAGTTDGTFGLYTGTGYLYAAAAGSNHLKTQETNDVNGDWTITITEGVASIIAEGSSNRNTMQYNPNSGSPIFSCYANASQKAIAIYKLSANEEIMEAHDCKDYAIGANCEDDATCTICGEIIENSALGHDYESVVTEATCIKGGYTTHTCSRCGDNYTTDETDALGHNFDGDSCSVCGEAKPTVGGTKTYTFSNYTAGTQYGKNEEHVLDENTIILTNNCHFTTQLRIYSSSTYNGYAIIKSVNPITSIGFNAGDKADTLVIYGSNDDGASWTEVARVDVKSAYADYTTELTTAYTCIKLDVAGSEQVRLKSITLTTGEPCDHSYDSVVTDPTCTVDGYTTYTCTECGHSYTDNTVAATGHNYVDGTCACGATKPTEHTCESVCGTCGKCTDAECNEDACADKCDGHNTTPTWTLTDIANIKSTDVVVIVWKVGNKYYAMTNVNGTGSAPAAVEVTVKDDKLTGEIADNIKWNISNNNGNLTIYPNGTTATWLYCTAANNGVRVGTNTNKTFTIDASSGYLKHTGTSRYLGVYTTNPDIRCYTNTTGNTANQTLAFYVYNEGTSGGDNGGNEGGDTLACEHANTTTTTTATCIAAGVETVTCDDCGETVSTTNVDALGHTTEDGTCERCGETIGGASTPTEPSTLATFEFGANGSASHSDGSEKSTYSETNNGYTLTLSSMSKVYGSARDAKGNSALKLGTSSAAGKFTFTVPDDVTKVIIYVAQYKANTTKITVNGTSYTITTASNNGAYTAIEIDTSENKTVSFTTVSGGYRAMVNTIEFWG